MKDKIPFPDERRIKRLHRHFSAFLRMMALLTALALLLTSCSSGKQDSSDESNIVLPEPSAQERQMILGDNVSSTGQEITLYYIADGSSELTSVTRSIQIEGDESLIERVLDELLNFSEGKLHGLPADTQILDVESSCGTVTVNLSINTGSQLSEQETLLRSLSISNTLLSIEGVRAVNILTGGRSEAVCSLPLGVITRQIDSAPTQYAQFQTERDHFLISGNSSISREALLYYPSSDGAYLIPELRSLGFSSENYASVVLQALQAEPANSSLCFSSATSAAETLLTEPKIYANEVGERVVDINFSAMLPNHLAFSGIEPWQFYGSLVLSLCSFVPELDAVRISLDGEPVESCMAKGKQISFTNKLMRRKDFEHLIGASSALHFSDASGNLVRVERAMPMSRAASAKGLLSEMISSAAPAGCTSVFPASIYADDILGVYVENRIASVNLSGNFYSRCQSLSAGQERNLIYGMVNTLAELPGIGAVRFLVEGMSVESLAQNIYLKTSLLPDPEMAG